MTEKRGRKDYIGQNSKRRAAAAVRRKSILELRCAGLTFEQIAAELGIARSTAQAALVTELRAVAAARRDLAEHQIDFELEQVDAVIRGMSPRVAKGDAHAGATMLRAMERRAKILGLDAPDRHEHTIDLKKLSDADLDAEIAALSAQREGAAPPPFAGADAPREGTGGDSG